MTRKSLPRTFVVTAALTPVLAAALAGCNSGDTSNAADSPKPGHHTSHKATHPATSAATSATTPAPSTPTAQSGTKAYAVYYVGHGGSGPVLYREFHSGPASTPAATLAVMGLSSPPLDPDYTTPWRTGDLRDAKANPDAGVILVTPSADWPRDRPTGMSAAYARIAIQQVVYTLQAAFQTRLPVQFIRNGRPIDRVLGVPTSEPVPGGKVLTTLSTMSISNPNEGARVSGSTLKVSGANNGFEGSVDLRLMQGSKVVAEQPGIGGFMGNRLYPWTITLDISKVSPGTYQLVARNDDPSGGEGRAAAVDTRTVVIS